MTLPLSLLLAHLIGDFFLQNDWMALNKSKRVDALYAHVMVYSACFVPWGWRFVLTTFLLHFCVDAITSRITSSLWFIDLKPAFGVSAAAKAWFEEQNAGFGLQARVWPEKRHWFFVVIGIDQFIHAACLAWTLHVIKLSL